MTLYLLIIHVTSLIILLYSMSQINNVLGVKFTVHNIPYFLLGGMLLFLAAKASFINPIVYLTVGALIGVFNLIISRRLSLMRNILSSISIGLGWIYFLAFMVYYMVNESKINEKFKSGDNSL